MIPKRGKDHMSQMVPQCESEKAFVPRASAALA